MKNEQVGVTAEAIAASFQEEGYQAKIRKVEDRAWIESAVVGVKFRIYLYSPSEEEGLCFYRNLMFDAGYTISLATRTDLLTSLCNQFNAEFRFLKTFVMKDVDGGYVGIQMDEAIVGRGVEGVIQSFDFFRRGIELFRERVVETKAYYGDKATSLHHEALQCFNGPEQHPEKGVALYREAAQAGFAGSQNNLGDHYELGLWAPRSDVFAAYWYARAAERGEPTAYLSLATLLLESAKDDAMLIEAMKFALLALKYLPEGHNQGKALDASRNLEELLSEEQIAEAQALAEDWAPLYQERRLMSDAVSSEEGADAVPQLLN